MIGYRRAAVALHGLHDEDRRLILAELSSEDRTKLVDYLEELDGLGFERDSTIVHGALATTVADKVPATSSEHIQQATAVQAYNLLHGEPSSLIAQVLALQRWSWTEGFLRMLEPVRRERIRGLAAGMAPLAPARGQALINTLAKRLMDNAAADHQLRLPDANAAEGMRASVRRTFEPVAKWVKSWSR